MKNLSILISIIASALLIFFVFIPSFTGDLIINPLIEIGPLTLRWYGLILACAILLGYLIARRNSWRFGISEHDVDDFSFWLVIVSILGARAYYVLIEYDYFSQNIGEVYKIWHGGISIYGGILSGLIFVWFYARKRVYGFWQLADLISLSLPLSQAVGRFGNFVNQEAFGTPTNLPWKMYVSPISRPEIYADMEFFHPTFLYEALASVLIFLILRQFIGKFRAGTITLFYLMAYSVFRFFIESIRVDSAFVYGFRIDQIMAFAVLVIAGCILFRRLKQVQPRLP